jgi:ribosomal protein S28E/S33
MANDTTLKPSLFIQTLAPVLEEESFLNFLRAYYEWLQSTNLTFTGKVGNFTNGEIVTGDDSKAKGIIKVIGSNYVVLKMLSDTPFDLKETFEGQTSGAIANVFEIKDNVIRASSRLEKNRNSDKSVDKYFEYLKSEFNRGFPTLSEVDRRLISNKLKDFYQSKSNEDAYRFLFRAVYGSEIEFRYPGEEILRVSDGDFEKTTIIRSAAPETIFNYLNQTIVGQTSGALGNVVDVKVTFLGGIRHAELTLKLVSGTFSAGETIYLLDDETEQTTIYGMISGTTIVDAGSGYSVGDVLTISGDGSEASAAVSSVSSGPINKIEVNAVGHGYRLDTLATVNNTGTGGSGFSVKVSELANTYTITSGANTYTVGEISKLSIVNRGSDYFKSPSITLDDNTIKTIGALSEKLITVVSSGNNYSVGDALVFTGGAGANAAGIIASVGNTEPYGANTILFEDGTSVLLENSVNGLNSTIKNEDWNNLGPILRIELTNFGTGYTPTNLPTISVTSDRDCW